MNLRSDNSSSGNVASGVRIIHVLVLVLVGLMWGTQPALIKALTQDGVPEIAALGAMLATVAIVLGLILLVRRRLAFMSRAKLAFMTINGAAEYAVPLLITFIVSRHIDAGLLTLIFSTTPIFTVAAAAVSGTEPLQRSSFLACGVGVLAFLAIILPQDALPSRDMLPWCLAAFGIPLSYAIGSVYVARNWPEDMDAVQVAFSGALFASLMLAPFWVGPIAEGRLFSTSPIGLQLFVILAASTIIEMGLYYYLLRNAGAVFTSFSSFIMIISGFVAGAMFFHESPTMWIWFSVVLFAMALGLIFSGHNAQKANAPKK